MLNHRDDATHYHPSNIRITCIKPAACTKESMIRGYLMDSDHEAVGYQTRCSAIRRSASCGELEITCVSSPHPTRLRTHPYPCTSESRLLLPMEISDSTPLIYDTNDDPESVSRVVLEKSLLRKLDFRTVYLVLIYVLNQVSIISLFISCHATMTRWTGITLRKTSSKRCRELSPSLSRTVLQGSVASRRTLA